MDVGNLIYTHTEYKPVTKKFVQFIVREQNLSYGTIRSIWDSKQGDRNMYSMIAKLRKKKSIPP